MAKIFGNEAPSEQVYDGRLLDPREIQINPEFNGRHDEPDIEDLLEDFMNPAIGQLAPVLITKGDNGGPELLAGHRRWRAAIRITELKQGPHTDAAGNKGVFKLRCQYFKGTPLERFIVTVRENIARRESLPIDDGMNISRLVNNFGMSHEDIAMKVYGRTLADGSPDLKWIKDREALSDLAQEASDAVSHGRVASSAVLALSKMSKKAQRDLIKSTEGKITAAVIKRASAVNAPQPAAQAVASNPSSDGPATSPTKRKWQKQDFCDLIQRYLDSDLPPHVLGMNAENAVRDVLGQIQDEMECGQ